MKRTNKIHIHTTQIVFFLSIFLFCAVSMSVQCPASVPIAGNNWRSLPSRIKHSCQATTTSQCAHTDTHTYTESLHASARVTRKHETNLSAHILSHPISRTDTHKHTHAHSNSQTHKHMHVAHSPSVLCHPHQPSLAFASCRYPRAHAAAHFLLLLLLLLLLPFCHHQRHQ